MCYTDIWPKGLHNHLISVLCVVLASVCCSAQTQAQQSRTDYEVLFQTIEKENRSSVLEKVIYVGDQEFFALMDKSKRSYTGYKSQPELMCVSHDMIVTNRREVDLEFYGKKSTLEFVRYHGDYIVLFVKAINWQTKETALIAQKIDPKSLERSGEPRIIMVFASRKINDGIKNTKFYDRQSPNGEYLIISGENFRSKKEVPYNQQVILDRDLAVVSSTDKKYEDSELENVWYVDLHVTDQGQGFQVNRLDNHKKWLTLDGEPQYHFEFVMTKEDEYHSTDYHIHDRLFMRFPRIYAADDGQVTCMMILSKGSLSVQEGMCRITVDVRAGTYDDSYLYDFPNEEMLKGNSESHKAKLENAIADSTGIGLVNFRPISLQQCGDGSYYSILEVNITREVPRQNVTHYYYYSRNIFVMKLGSDFSVRWCRSIPKDQYSLDDLGQFISHGSMVTSDNALVLIYNDNKKNAENDGEGVPNKGKMRGTNFTTQAVRLEPSGEISKTILFPAIEKIRAQPRYSHQLSENQIIMTGFRPLISESEWIRITVQ